MKATTIEKIAVGSFPDFHDWTLQGIRLIGDHIWIELALDENRHRLILKDVVDFRFLVNRTQIVVSDFHYEIVSDKNVERVIKVLENFGLKKISVLLESLFISADFHVGADFVCLCRDIEVIAIRS